MKAAVARTASPLCVGACLLGCSPFHVQGACEHHYLCLQVAKVEDFSIMCPVPESKQRRLKKKGAADVDAVVDGLASPASPRAVELPAVGAEDVAAARLEREIARTTCL